MAQFPPAMAPQPFDFGGMLINNVSSFPSNSHLANQPPPAACQVPFTGMTSLPNALINNFSSNPNFGFNRPFSAKSPAQLRRASSASMEAGKGGRMGSSSMAQLNGGGTRPASLQHHELLFLGPDPHQQQRTTPVPRKFEPVEATLVEDRVEEQKTAADAGRAQTPVQPKEQHSGLLRRNNSMSSGDHQQTSSSISGGGGGGGPQSAFPTLGDYSMFSSSNMAPNSLQANSASANADSNVTLWQFLLELLAANDHPNLIQWTNNEGEFKLLDAEAVARLWGIRKGKPNMNYDKLSRALRYYYDKNIIKKVIGQKFVYRFVMDGKQSGGGDLGLGMAGNPELVKYAINKAQNGIMNGGGEKRAPEAPRFEHNGSLASSHHPTTMLNPHQRNHPATASCSSSLADSSSKAAPSSSSTLNPPPNHRGTLNGGNPTTMTPSPVNSSSSPAGSVESSSGVSSGSGMSASFAVPNMGGGQFLGLVPVKSEPGVAGTLAGGGHGQYNTSPSTASTSAGGPPPSFGGPAPLLVEKVRLNRKRKSPLEAHQHQQSSLTVSHSGMASSSSSAAFDRQQSHEDGSAPKMGCNNTGPSLSRRGRPQPLDLTSVNNSSVSHLTGQMSQMVASSPLLYALQQHHHQQQQQQQSPLLSAALLSSALSNYAASPLASVASPLAQAAAFQLASNLVATLSPSMNQNSNAGCGTSGMANYGFNTGSNGNGQNSNNCLNTGNLYSQLHSALRRTSEAPNSWDNSNNIGSFLGGPKEDGYALTTPISQVKTPLQQQQPPLSNSAMISAVINHLTNGPNTPFQHHQQQQQQQQQQQAQQQQQLFQFPASSNMANLAQTLAMLSSPGMPLANQSPFPFVSQMASLQTPKFSAVNLQAGNQRSPDSLKTPMGGLSFEFGQALAAAAANKK